jgi:phage shock protein C
MNAAKRLFQRKDGAVVSGLCNGIADYVNVDANLVRIWWVGLSFFIGAKTLLIYAVLMFIVPYDEGEKESTALVDTQTLKVLILKGDSRGLRQYSKQFWTDTLRRWNAVMARV